MAASVVGYEEEEEEEWEAINNDGFVYKRKKRHRPDPPTTSPDNNIKNKIKNKKRIRRRRKETLLKIKERYENEITKWELLSNTFKALSEKRENIINGKMLVDSGGERDRERERLVDSAFTTRIDELAIKVEADHAIIQGISNVCDTTEAICDAEEQHLKKEYLDLPIWVSPQEIMAVLCDTHSQTENGEGSG